MQAPLEATGATGATDATDATQPDHVYVRRGLNAAVWRIAPDRFVHRGAAALRVSQTSWGRHGALRTLFSARSYFSSQEGDSTDPNTPACRMWLPRADTISVISSYHDADVEAGRQPPHNVAATAWLVRVEIFNEFLGDVGRSFYWQLDYNTCRKLARYLRVLEPTSALRRAECTPTPEILHPLHYSGSTQVMSTGDAGWSPAATLMLLSMLPAPNPTVKTINGARWRDRAALERGDDGVTRACAERTPSVAPTPTTTTTLALVPATAGQRTRGTALVAAAWTRDAAEWTKRRKALDPFVVLPGDMLGLVADHLLASPAQRDWSSVLALRRTCHAARDVVELRAADLVLDAHATVADCVAPPEPMSLARIVAGGKRLLRAGLFAPAVLRELAAARDANARAYRSDEERAECAHALFLQLGRLRTHRPPLARPPRPPRPELLALTLACSSPVPDGDGAARAPLTPLSNPSPTAKARSRRRKLSAREAVPALQWERPKRQRSA